MLFNVTCTRMPVLKLNDCLEGLREIESDSINCVVTSPPYNKNGLQGKTTPGNQIWDKFNIDYDKCEDNMPEDLYQDWMVAVLDELHRVLKPDGSIFFNHKPRRHKNQAYLPTDFISRSSAVVYQLIIWDRRSSPNIRKDVLVPCTEHIYWLRKKKPKVFRDSLPPEYIGEVWRITAPKQKLHPAPFPELLVENCIKLSTEPGDVVLDPFCGSGTAGVVSHNLGRKFIGIEYDDKYFEIASQRIANLST